MLDPSMAELRNFTAIGVNLASRLEPSAESAQIVIGAATYAQIRDIAVVRELGGIAVKGKAAPVEVFVLLGPRQSSAAPAAAQEHHTPGAGRARMNQASGRSRAG